MAMNLHTMDLAGIKITGYCLDSLSPLEKDSDNVLVAFGRRIRDGLPVVAKLSYQGLRLEREYHIAQRLYKFSDASQVLSQPLEKVILSHGPLP
ncbi:unnamed protein product [Absidia cylindrospora]